MQTNLFGNSSAAASAGGGVQTSTDISQTKDMFTKLLVAQIKNQDPLSPTDPSQFVNQLSQLSQTESLQSLATLTSTSASLLQSMQVLALGAQVGADVMVTTTTVALDAQKVAGSITLASASTKTSLVLTGADGKSFNVALGTQGAGAVPFAIDPAALGLPAGTYSMRVETSPAQSPPAINITGKLSSVRLAADGGIALNVAHVGEVAPGAVTGFNGKSADASSTI